MDVQVAANRHLAAKPDISRSAVAGDERSESPAGRPAQAGGNDGLIEIGVRPEADLHQGAV
jgi:hypothetical protein